MNSCVASWLLLGCLLSNPTAATDEAPKGEVFKYTFERSKIFPGTSREISIYVPAQYAAAKSACLYVNQDGIQFNAPQVLDELIYKREMPITIGVFVTPGVVKAASVRALPRLNRSVEYDELGDEYVRFLLDELLPDVETKTTKDGRAITFSKDGNDRAIGGESSGAICAFTAAWERPDSFRRVFSAVGSYLGLRGGNSYSTLIRKYEPKPIRIFLEAGSKDLNHFGGDSWMANQAMERSLVFAGYEVVHNWGTGDESVEHATEIFPDAMRWLWKDWPDPVKAGDGSLQLQEILIPAENWKIISKGNQSTRLAVNGKGEVFFNDVRTRKSFRVAADGETKEFLSESKPGDGQAFGPDGRLYANAVGTDEICAWDANGNSVIITEGIRGRDIVVDHHDGVYVSSPSWTGIGPSKIWYISSNGMKKIVDSGLKYSSGICLSPDHTLLYVADRHTHWVYSYQIQADGSLTHKQKYIHLHSPDAAEDSGANGMRCDCDGRVWVATQLGLQVCDQTGHVICIIPTPNGIVTDLTFGGEAFDVLYCTSGDQVYSRKIKVRGANGWESPSNSSVSADTVPQQSTRRNRSAEFK